MIPKDVPCKFCGAGIIWVPGYRDRKIPIEAGWTPYTRHPEEACNTTLFTNEGGRIWCRVLPPEMDDQVEGYAHKMHVCQSRTTKREPTERERAREEYKAFREEQARG